MHRTLNRGRGLAALVLVAAGLVAGPAAGQSLPKWLLDAQAREATLKPLTEVASDDGWFRSRVPGTVAHPIRLEEGSYSVVIEVAAGVSVSCEVLREPGDLAGFLSAAADASFVELAKAHGAIQAKAVEASQAGIAGSHPYISLRWVYRVVQGGEARIGALKQFAVDRGDALIYCAHDELGYVQTFDAAARALATHFRAGPAAPGAPEIRPHFREVSVVSMDGQPVGLASTTMTLDADGDTKVVNRTSMLVQRAPGQLLAQDSADIQWVRADGSLINATQVKVAQGTTTEEMKLVPAADGNERRWRASGKIGPKAIDVEIEGSPSSFVALARARRQMLGAAAPVGASTDSTIWSSMDLTRLVPARASVLAAAGPEMYTVREELGGVAMEVVLDRRTGTMASGRLPLGARTLNFERVLREGEFR
jgi:hypothetical protein